MIAALPAPRLTATITPGESRGQLGRVEVHDLARVARVPRRMNHCSACGELGHNAANRRCPGPASGVG